MATTWTYDPTTVPVSDKDRVRMLVGDTVKAHPLVQDEEILLALEMSGGVYGGAGLIARALAARYARLPNLTVGGKSVSGSVIAERYLALAAKWEGEASDIGVPIYAAGITWSDGDSDRFDPDVKKPPFDDIGHHHGWYDEERLP